MPPSRWFAVGLADGSQPDAGLRAADKALPHNGAKLVIVFCSHANDLGRLAAQINDRSGSAPMIGCTTAGEIAAGGGGAGSVVVAALGGDGFAIETAAATGASHDLRGAGAAAARCFSSPPADHPHRALLMLTDGLAGDQQEILRGAYAVLGAGVPVVGGCAGDDLQMTRTFQLHGDQVLTNSVVVAGIASNAPLGMEGNAESVLEATDAACSASLASLEDRLPLGMLAFDCIARRNVLGVTGIRAEIDRLLASARGAPVAGFYTYGEIARTRGMPGFHNQTLVVLSLA